MFVISKRALYYYYLSYHDTLNYVVSLLYHDTLFCTIYYRIMIRYQQTNSVILSLIREKREQELQRKLETTTGKKLPRGSFGRLRS